MTTVWVRLPVTVTLPTVCCVFDSLLWLCFWLDEEFAVWTVPEEEFAVLFALEEIPGCTAAEDVGC